MEEKDCNFVCPIAMWIGKELLLYILFYLYGWDTLII